MSFVLLIKIKEKKLTKENTQNFCCLPLLGYKNSLNFLSLTKTSDQPNQTLIIISTIFFQYTNFYYYKKNNQNVDKYNQ